MTSLEHLLLTEAVFAGARWHNRKQVLLEMSQAAEQQLGLEDRSVFDAILERERLGSTGVGEGVAIPHARMASIKQPVGLFARLAEPVDFEAIDDRACDLVFMLLAPENAGADHLKALARVSRMFREERIRMALRKAPNADALVEILCPAEAHDAA